MTNKNFLGRLLFIVAFCLPFITARAQTYCTPTYANPYNCNYNYSRIIDLQMRGVSTNYLYDNPPCGDYNDRTAVLPPLQLAAGRTHTGYMKLFFTASDYVMWIDYNDNGDFSNDERVSAGGTTVNNPNPATVVQTGSYYYVFYGISIQVPANTPAGTHRMRIRTYYTNSQYPGEVTACDLRYAGETHDYLVTITAPDSCAPVFTTQPTSAPGCDGNTNIMFTVATDIPAHLQWHVNDGTGWVPVTDNAMHNGANNDTLFVTGATTGYMYRCVAASGSCYATSQYVAYRDASITINTHPAGKTVVESNPLMLTSSATQRTGTSNVWTWQEDDGTGFKNITQNMQYQSLNPFALNVHDISATQNGYKYRAVVTNSTCAATTGEATLTVQDIHVPGQYYARTATTASSVPFGGTAPYRMQQMFYATDFGSNPKSGYVKTIYFKAATNVNTPTVFTDFKVKLGNSTVLSLTDFLPGLTTVLDTASYSIGPLQQNHWFAIDLQTPVYVDLGQQTVVEVSYTTKSNAGFTILAGGLPYVNTSPSHINRLIRSGTSTTNNTSRNSCQFGFDMFDCSIAADSALAGITIYADAGICSASGLVLDTPAYSSSCALAITNNAPAVYPKGTTTVTWVLASLTDTVTLTQKVTVVDNQPPVITCPANIAVTAPAGHCSAVVNYDAPAVSDNCGTCTAPSAIDGYTLMGTYGGHTYFKSNVGNTWEYFDSAAKAMGGHLATVSDLAENNFLNAYPGGVWIGLTDKAQEGTYVWSNGEPVNYTFWCGNEPNNEGDEDYVMITWGGNGCWNDGDDSLQNWNLQGIIEFDCDSSTVPFHLARTAGIASGGTFQPGTTTVSYSAKDDANNTASCSFTVTVQPATTVSINVTPLGLLSTGGVPTNIYLGYGPQTALVTANVANAGTGTYTYQWSPATNLVGANYKSAIFVPTAAGNYTYTVTATNSSTGCSFTQQVTFCVKNVNAPGFGKVYLCHNGNTVSVSILAVHSHLSNHAGDQLGKCSDECGANKGNENDEPIEDLGAEEVQVYPNPTTGAFTVQLPAGVESADMVMVDIAGKVIMSRNGINGTAQFEQSNLAKGVYMIYVKYSTETSRTKLVVH